MRKSLPSTNRTTAVHGALCLTLAALLGGCASKNPLIDEPAAPSASARPPASSTAPADSAVNTNTAVAATAAAPATNVAPAPVTTADGVKTKEPTAFERFVNNWLRPYKIDIRQGNLVSREMVAQLKEGMQRPEGVTREQVRFALGTPLLTDIFHADRWDYVFRLQKRSGEVISSRVTVFFKENRLSRIEGDQLPTEQEYLGYIAGSPTETGKK